jgi:hypothetical protein
MTKVMLCIDKGHLCPLSLRLVLLLILVNTSIMKKLLICLSLLLSISSSYACTVCGSSASNQNLGILPLHHKHFVGVQYQHRTFTSIDGDHESRAAPEFSRESYHTLQVWGRYNIGQRVQVFAFVPYVTNFSEHEGKVRTAAGLGDISALATVQLIKKKDCCPGLKHSLQTGAGIKLPTGAYDRTSVSTEEGLPNMQPGTRSYDMLFVANYTVRHEELGANIEASYVLTTPNPYSYKYGDRVSTSASAFYWLRHRAFSFLPQAGLRYDHAWTDYDNYTQRWKSEMSGGDQLYASAGLQVYHKHIGLRLSADIPAVCGRNGEGWIENRGVYPLPVLTPDCFDA